MGNTPSHQHGTPSRHGDGTNLGRSGSQRRQNNLRLSMPQRNAHVSPQSSHPNSPSGRPGSPRRRRSLELPDLNRLSFTPAAPQPTTATNTSNHLATGTGSRTPSGRRPAAAGAGAAAGTSGRAPMSPSKDASGAASPPPPPPDGVTVVPVNDHTTYFPSQPIPIRSPRGGNADLPSPERRPRPELKPVSDSTPRRTGLTPPPPTVSATPQPGAAAGGDDDGLVDVPIQWTGGGRTVLVTGNFADNWRGRIKLRKSTHDFNTVLRLAPGQYRLKFLVDDSWRCSKSMPTATDNDGTLVNYVEVEAPKSESDQVGWAVDDMTTAPAAQPDDSQWTNEIPPALSLYAYLEELPGMLSSDELRDYVRRVPYFSPVPKPPQLPRILERVILNQQARPEVPVIDAQGNQIGGSDDNAVLPTPSSSVLGHLLASAVRGGSLGLATTTRYRKKYITTVLFRPIHEQAPQGDAAADDTSPAATLQPGAPSVPAHHGVPAPHAPAVPHPAPQQQVPQQATQQAPQQPEPAQAPLQAQQVQSVQPAQQPAPTPE